MSPAVLLRPFLSARPQASDTADLDRVAALARDVDGRSDRALAVLPELGTLPWPGAGDTRRRWEVLATLAAVDLTAARVAEAHLDALAVLAEQGGSAPDPGRTWGVFAAEGGDRPVRAALVEGTWRLSGVKPWCSLAGMLSHALVTAHVDGGRRLFAIALRDPSVRAGEGEWVSRGLADVPSGPIELDDTPAEPVGDVDWYLRRPGFAWGGVGVAACWYGGAVGVARLLATRIRSRADDTVGLLHLGAVDVALVAARTALAAAADEIDSGAADPALLANRVRAVVAGAAEQVLHRTGHALGPAPLAQDEEHARRVADLQIYLRQHHAERDDAALGAMIPAGGAW